MCRKMAVQGSAFYCVNEEEVRYVKDGLFCIDEKGYIEQVYEKENEAYEKTRETFLKEGTLKVLSDKEIMIPGFVDLHNHASQWPQAGTALDRPLEIWLGEYTFPLESQYKDLEFASKVYKDLVQNTLNHGTTTAMYFATVDREPSVLLAKICGETGQRGLVGKVVMDDPYANPEFCRDQSAKEAVEET